MKKSIYFLRSCYWRNTATVHFLHFYSSVNWVVSKMSCTGECRFLFTIYKLVALWLICECLQLDEHLIQAIGMIRNNFQLDTQSVNVLVFTFCILSHHSPQNTVPDFINSLHHFCFAGFQKLDRNAWNRISNLSWLFDGCMENNFGFRFATQTHQVNIYD